MEALTPSFLQQDIEVSDDDAVVEAKLQLVQQLPEVPLPVQPADVGLVVVVLQTGQKGPYFVDEMLDSGISELQA